MNENPGNDGWRGDFCLAEAVGYEMACACGRFSALINPELHVGVFKTGRKD